MTEFTKASDNLFEDLGFSPAEAAVLKIKTDLSIDLEIAIKAHGMTQVAAAKQLGISRPKLNRVLNGKIDGISIDKLVEMNERIGNNVIVKTIKKTTPKVIKGSTKKKPEKSRITKRRKAVA